ncbi:MAG: metallophosphoesterase family protein [Peptococcaceae bacterium]|nr:metallophosphoesterase family protein [Peptococcaceae bacterium]
MMIGIFSDVHGDSAAIALALDAVKSAERIFFLGDVHEFVPEVKQCIDMLRAAKVTAVRGNCDRHGVIGDRDGSYQAWLAGLPKEYRQDDLVFVHEPKDPQTAFGREGFHICFCGHTHRSFVLTEHNQVKLVPGQIVVLKSEQKYIVCIGSAAKPRGGEANVAALYDTKTGHLELIAL